MPDVVMWVGFVLATAGVYLNFGLGWACLVSGGVLFVAGGLMSRREGVRRAPGGPP